MLSIKNEEMDLSNNIIRAIKYLKKSDLDKARELILCVIEKNPNLGKTHELLGIYNELKGDINLAMRHYRAAIALEPNLTSAINNLERICEFKYICSNEYIDYGE